MWEFILHTGNGVTILGMAGSLETRAKRVRRRGDVERAVLIAAGTAGLLALATLAPNALAALSYLPKSQKRFFYQARTVAGRLAQKGLITFVESGDKKYIRLTPKGRVLLELEKAKTKVQSASPKRWDRRFRVIIFDIPEKRRLTRERFRRLLLEAGFHRLQDSIWVYPYDCEELVTLMKAELKVGGDILYMVVEQIENDRRLREHFSLPVGD